MSGVRALAPPKREGLSGGARWALSPQPGNTQTCSPGSFTRAQTPRTICCGPATQGHCPVNGGAQFAFLAVHTPNRELSALPLLCTCASASARMSPALMETSSALSTFHPFPTAPRSFSVPFLATLILVSVTLRLTNKKFTSSCLGPTKGIPSFSKAAYIGSPRERWFFLSPPELLPIHVLFPYLPLQKFTKGWSLFFLAYLGRRE